jgi:hypothetical protein
MSKQNGKYTTLKNPKVGPNLTEIILERWPRGNYMVQFSNYLEYRSQRFDTQKSRALLVKCY